MFSRLLAQPRNERDPAVSEHGVSDARRRNMAAIRHRDTDPEMIVRRFLHSQGLRFRLHVRGLPGRPDLVFPKHRAVVEVRGCFWHMHECATFRWPVTRATFWREKLESNARRDFSNRRKLLDAGWRVALVWECALKDEPRRSRSLSELRSWIRSDSAELELGEI